METAVDDSQEVVTDDQGHSYEILERISPPSHRQICLNIIHKIEGEMAELGTNLDNIPGQRWLRKEEMLFDVINDALQDLTAYVKGRDDD